MKTISVKSVFKTIAIIVIVLSVFSCNNGSYSENLKVADVDLSEDFETIEEAEEMASFKQDGTANLIETPVDLKIIKSASARYKVASVTKATEQIKVIAGQYDAYISDLRFENNLYQKENRFTIKVPSDRFDAIMDSIGSVVEFVEYENITTKDVTEEYIDLQTRLKTKLEVKARYEEVLRKNARTVEDILNTEDKLRVIQEEIEAAQGRLKYLTSKVSYSTIQIDLYETVEYIKEPDSYKKSFAAKAKNGLSFGWNMIEAIVLGLIHIWPILFIIILLTVILWRRLKK
ncbi:DUF4349 domain-containing protein [Constantimarinum furrinae]|uniref:DUF4349 domain-containing protein n=1 Tax=Constantimarinum furrinae TaxID=2562285 RepID=A0A7G8PUS4_9FLAO|nr:DUF4349 domain-containing protein [Constantimarinum furrinae]QNJ98090.1 hypothetical protein ALE3EI_1532 [Constantimarinum furrinae]